MVPFAVVCFCATAISVFAQSIPAAEPDPFYKDNRERFQAYLFRTYTDPMRIGWLLMDSGMDHWARAPRNWDQSPESFTYRFASGWGRRIVRNTAQFGFETLLKEDSRYRPLVEGRLGKRAWFAVSHSVLAYKPDGSAEPMYGRVAAGVVAAATSSTWHPQSTTAGCLATGLAMATVDRAGDNLLQEFGPDLKRFGLRTWKHVIGK